MYKLLLVFLLIGCSSIQIPNPSPPSTPIFWGECRSFNQDIKYGLYLPPGESTILMVFNACQDNALAPYKGLKGYTIIK